MPPVSKKQAGYMGAAAAGKAKGKNPPSKAVAKEYLRGSKVKGLPTKKGK